MSEQPPYMKTYVKDTYAETAHLDLEEQGALFRLRCYMWINGGKVENDDGKLARALGVHRNKWRKIRGNIEGNLVVLDGGYLTISGLQDEYNKADNKRATLSANGSKGGRPKKGSKPPENNESEKAEGLANALPDENQEESNSKANEKPNGLADGNQKPYPPTPSLSPSPLIDNDIDYDGGGGKVDNFSRRSKKHEHTGGPVALGSILPPMDDDNYVRTLEVVFIKQNLPFPVDVHLVSTWVQNGADFDLDVLPAVKGVCERVVRRLLKPPTSFAYFQEAVNKAVIKRVGISDE